MQLTETTSGRATLSPEHQLLAKILFAADPKEVLDIADHETIRVLVRTLQQNEMAEELGIKPCDPTRATHEQLKAYIIEFKMKGLGESNLAQDEITRIKHVNFSHLGSTSALRSSDLFDEEGIQRGSVRIMGRVERQPKDGPKNRRKSLREIKQGRIGLQQFLKEWAYKDGTRENINKLALLIETLLSDSSDPPISFSINGTNYNPALLFIKGGKTDYYIHPIATGLLLEGCGWAPKLSQEERENRISTKYMAVRIYGNNVAKYTHRLDTLAEKLLSFDAVDIGTPEAPYPILSTDIVKRARRGSGEAYYFALSSQPLLEKYLGVEKEGLSADCAHFISDLALAHEMKLNRNPVHTAIEDIADELWELWAKNGGVPLYDETSKHPVLVEPQDIIRESRPGGRKVIYYIDPHAIEQYFSKSEIVRHIEKRQSEEHTRDPDRPQPRPINTHDWLSPARAAQKINLSGREGTRVVTALMKQLHGEGNQQIGYFAAQGARGGATYFANPAIVGHNKLLNRQRVLEIMQEMTGQDPNEQAATSPER